MSQDGGRLLTEKELADKLGLSIDTVRLHRRAGCGVPHIKINGSIRYHPDDIEDYLRQHRAGAAKATGVQHAGAA